MSSSAGTLVVLDDVFTEATDGQYIEIDLVDPEGTAIATSTIASITGTLRSLDTQAAIFAQVDLLASGRATYPGALGRIRITFSADDVTALGSRERQRRELTLVIRHHVTHAFVCAVHFSLLTLRDVA